MSSFCPQVTRRLPKTRGKPGQNRVSELHHASSMQPQPGSQLGETLGAVREISIWESRHGFVVVIFSRIPIGFHSMKLQKRVSCKDMPICQIGVTHSAIPKPFMLPSALKSMCHFNCFSRLEVDTLSTTNTTGQGIVGKIGKIGLKSCPYPTCNPPLWVRAKIGNAPNKWQCFPCGVPSKPTKRVLGTKTSRTAEGCWLIAAQFVQNEDAIDFLLTGKTKS